MFIRNRFTMLMAVTALAGMLAAGRMAIANPVTLVDDNAEATIDLESQSGMSDWIVDDVHHLYQQWFWYRVGDGGGEHSIDTLPIDISGTTDTDFDGDDETLFVRYRGPGFDIELRFSLDGGSPGSGLSDMAEQITILNTGPRSLDFHFFQYSDFDLNETAGDDSVRRTNQNTWVQWDPSVTFSETVVTPAASHHQAASWPTLLAELNNGTPTTLTDFGGPLGPTDATWAFQWDFHIGPGGSAQISKDKNIQIPAPGAVLLGMMGLGMVRWARRRIA